MLKRAQDSISIFIYFFYLNKLFLSAFSERSRSNKKYSLFKTLPRYLLPSSQSPFFVVILVAIGGQSGTSTFRLRAKVFYACLMISVNPGLRRSVGNTP